jgi:hypothetical protein
MSKHSTRTPPVAPSWMRNVLLAAAIYNIVWGAWAVLFPNAYFDWAGMTRPVYPEIWQCVGMIVGVYGVGYAIAAFNPMRHWPIVFVGLMGKILGPLGFAKALLDGTFTWKAGLNIITNDLIWWVPFTIIVLAALRKLVTRPYQRGSAQPLDEALEERRLESGETLAEASRRRPLLLCFLRHYG